MKTCSALIEQIGHETFGNNGPEKILVPLDTWEAARQELIAQAEFTQDARYWPTVMPEKYHFRHFLLYGVPIGIQEDICQTVPTL